ncbi:MAG: hypothetical protein ABSF65_07850 [Candidatus Bathyarchaeia archaeon]|jgi:hypothetical protein
MRTLKVDFADGELHYVFEESTALIDISKRSRSLNEAEAKKITKREASKLLFIAREE